MTTRLARPIFIGGVFAAVTGCQPSLDPAVPTGSAAYDVIAPSAAPSNPGGYLLRVGDTVSVLVFQEPDLSQENSRIDFAGNLYLPLIGSVEAAGLSPRQLAQRIEGAYGASYLRNPQVTVRIDAEAVQTVAVEGEVELPGIYEVKPGYTLLTALAAARSPTNTAKLDQVIIFRMVDGQRVGGLFDVQEIRSGSADDPAILPGDVIVVGYSSLRGSYRDILQAAPLFNAFVLF